MRETVSFIFVSKKKMFTVTTPSVTSPAPTVRAPTPIPERVGRAREKCKDTREEREKRGGFLDRFGEHFRFFFLRVVLKVTSSAMKRETRIDSEILNAKRSEEKRVVNFEPSI